MIRLCMTAIAALVTFGVAQAAPQEPARPVLKAEAIVTGDIVRIGDLIDNAGIIANVPVFRAPDLGSTGTVPVDAVIEAVRSHALIGLDTAGLTEVAVIRASRAIPAKDIEDGIAQALSKQNGLGEPKNIAIIF
jgi:flagella basal body P-ring formation protein FlgA